MTNRCSPYLQRPVRTLDEVIAEVEPTRPDGRTAAEAGKPAGSLNPETAVATVSTEVRR